MIQKLDVLQHSNPRDYPQKLVISGELFLFLHFFHIFPFFFGYFPYARGLYLFTPQASTQRLILFPLDSMVFSGFPYKQSKLHPGMTPNDIILIYVRKYRMRTMIIMIGVVLCEILSTSVSYVVKSLVDVIGRVQSGQESIGVLFFLVALVPVVNLLGHLFFRMSGFTARSFFPYMRRDVRVDFFGYLHSHAHRYFSNHFGGALTNKISTVGRSVEEVFSLIAWDLLPSLVNIIFSLGLLFLTNVLLGGVTLSIIVVYLAMFYPFLKRVRKLQSITAESKSFSTGKIADVISNIWNLQSHARGKFEESHLVEVLNQEADKNRRSWGYMEFIRLWQGTTTNLFIGLIGALTVWLWSNGGVSVGSVVLVFMISLSILQTVRGVAQRLLDFNERKSEIQDAITTILVPYEIAPVQALSTEAPISSGSIELKNMTFAYDTRGNVFENLSLSIPHGQKVGFVGVSGSGKSSLVLLLQRFYDIQSGAIEIGGHNISSISQDTLRRAIAVVPQDPVLFHRSLFENIAYGSPDATLEDVVRAAKLAHADEFIASLPEWYDAKVGERGVKLSGGQRQRVAIARAILKSSPILLLDEATSALDSESEELIQNALENVMQGKTVIAIAHRLSTLKNMDRIIVLEKGKIIEDGSHEELLARSGTYAYLYKKQAGGFMNEDIV